jgi:hypothetical protein
MTWHVYPCNDIKDHDIESTTCECGPNVIFEEGSMIVLHNSFDNREVMEQVKEILNGK